MILVFFTFYASSGFVATGRLFETLFGMHYHDAMFWGSVVMLAYTFFGGFLAVSWSDVLQGTLMFFALILVAAMGVGLAGGFGEMLATLEAREPALLDPFLGSGGEALGVDRHRLAAGVGPRLSRAAAHPRALHGDPLGRRDADGPARGDGLGDRRAARGRGRGPRRRRADLAAARRARTPRRCSSRCPRRTCTRCSPGICLAGILAAIMSTASAQLLVASSAFAQDFYKGLFRRDPGRAELLWVGRARCSASRCSPTCSRSIPRTGCSTSSPGPGPGFGAAFGPAIVLSLYWPRMTRNGALAGMLVGGLTVILWKQGSGGIFELYEMVPGVVLSRARDLDRERT